MQLQKANLPISLTLKKIVICSNDEHLDKKDRESIFKEFGRVTCFNDE